jgi:hypothetical protein
VEEVEHPLRFDNEGGVGIKRPLAWGRLPTRLQRLRRDEVINKLQGRALAELSADTAKHPFIKEIYIFGSVARAEDSLDDMTSRFNTTRTG